MNQLGIGPDGLEKARRRRAVSYLHVQSLRWGRRFDGARFVYDVTRVDPASNGFHEQTSTTFGRMPEAHPTKEQRITSRARFELRLVRVPLWREIDARMEIRTGDCISRWSIVIIHKSSFEQIKTTRIVRRQFDIRRPLQ
ncbi:hypothetical protein [Pendulispora albinea]|uniref:Uncharacterized protein n=1 Tax=Pendulispora albinea TaxID=2741071 RepID=A0ABZ2M791_9BACT